MLKLRINLDQNKPEFKLICQFALVSICEDNCILKIDNGTGFGQHKWTHALVAEVIRPRMLTVVEGNLEALSHQLQSQLRISHQDLIEIHPSYGKTTVYGQHSPLAIGPRVRGCFGNHLVIS